jgi:hypothetical protein
MKRLPFITLTLLLSQPIGLVLQPAQAADGDVKIAGQTVFTAQAAADAGSVSARASTIQNNLDNALVAAPDRSPASVNIAYVRGLPVITLGGYQVVAIDPADASQAHTTPAVLAQKWADSMRRAMSDQNSINSYVSQLTGSYSAGGSAVAPVTSQAPASAPPYPQYGKPGEYDTYNSTGSPPNNYNAPSENRYAGSANYQNQAGNSYSGGNNYERGNGYGGGNNWQSGNASGGPPNNYGNYQNYPPPQGGPPQGYRQGRVAYAPAGQVIPVTLATSIATQVAREGDLIQANITQNINLGDSSIPAGSVVIGQVTEAKSGRRLTKSGELQIKFNRIRTPDGTETPITAHLVGGIMKYHAVGGTNSDTFKGEGMGNKLGSVAFRGLVGTGGGAALGTAVGAIAGGGGGAGAGAWSGAAIGGGLGVADSLLLRKGKDVTIPSGTNLQLQLDSPVSVAGVVPGGGGY